MEHEDTSSEVLKRMRQAGIRPLDIVSGADIAAQDGENGALAAQEVKTPIDPPSSVRSAGYDSNEDDDELSEFPTIVDQYLRVPDSCRLDAPQTVIFNLSDAEQLKSFNELQGRTIVPQSKTGNIIMEAQHDFFNGAHYARVTYQNIKYTRLV